MGDQNLTLVEKLWSLEEVKVSASINETYVRKVRFSLITWRDQYKALKMRQDGKNGDIKDMKSDMYQLIGFFSVFQGVLFEGVSKLSIAYRFRYIPMTLLVAATVGTIFGVFLKFTDLVDIQFRSNEDAIGTKELLYYINGIERQGKDFSFQPRVDPSLLVGVPGASGGAPNTSTSAPVAVNYSNPSEAERLRLKKQHDDKVVKKRARLEKELENAKYMKNIILVYLFLLGSGFAYVLSVIMCKEYY